MASTADPENEEHPAPEPFSKFLFAQRNGTTHAELTDGLAELVAAVMETGKGGKLLLSIEVKPASKSGGNQLLVSDSVAVKAPKPARSESIFFGGENGSLLRTDPRQPQLPLTEVPRPTHTELKEAR